MILTGFIKKNHISSRTRSKVEIPRYDEQNFTDNFTGFENGVASPETCVGSPSCTETPELQCYASPPVMREIINTHDSCAYPVNDSHRVDSFTDSHGGDSVSEVQEEIVGESIQLPSYDMMQSVPQQEDVQVTDSPAPMSSSDVSDLRVLADLGRFLNEMRAEQAEFRNTSSLVDNIKFWPPAPNITRDTPNSDDNGPT